MHVISFPNLMATLSSFVFCMASLNSENLTISQTMRDPRNAIKCDKLCVSASKVKNMIQIQYLAENMVNSIG